MDQSMGPTVGQALPIAEAARALGMTTSAVRQRVKRGSFPAVKGEDGCWRVLVDQAQRVLSGDPGTSHGSAPGSTNGTTHGTSHGSPNGAIQDTNRAAEATIHLVTQGRPTVNPDPLVDQLRDENAFLRAELKRVGEERAEELRRKDVILSQLAQSLGEVSNRLEALPQATTSAIREAEIIAPEPAASWWRRLLQL